MGAVAHDRPANTAHPSIIGSDGEQPVTIQVVVQVLQVVQSRGGGLPQVAAAVVPPVAVEPQIATGCRHDLPQAHRLLRGKGKGIESAFHQG